MAQAPPNGDHKGDYFIFRFLHFLWPHFSGVFVFHILVVNLYLSVLMVNLYFLWPHGVFVFHIVVVHLHFLFSPQSSGVRLVPSVLHVTLMVLLHPDLQRDPQTPKYLLIQNVKNLHHIYTN